MTFRSFLRYLCAELYFEILTGCYIPAQPQRFFCLFFYVYYLFIIMLLWNKKYVETVTKLNIVQR